MLEKTITEAINTTSRLVETGMKKAWSILDAAVEKKSPSEALSKQGIRAIQGKQPGG
jgi:hypothetical protein